MVFSVSSPVHFHFTRGGGAIVAARISIWEGVGGADPKRVEVVNFDHPTRQAEDVSVVLAAGSYTCVFKGFIRKDLNGRYRFDVQVDGQGIFGGEQAGDVNEEPEQAAQFEAQFDIDL